MTRSRIRGDLIAKLAAGHVRRVVDKVADQAVREVRDQVPDAKSWETAEDERVRPSHDETHGQTIPANLLYRLPKQVYVRKGRGENGKAVNAAGGWKIVPGGWDLADAPRDPRLPEHQTINCRCESLPMPGMIAAHVGRIPVLVTRTSARATVHVRFPRIAESEFEPDGGGWLARAARIVAARHR
ncbi:hypothetical protein ACQP10_38035 (plasmid) [Streptosporangium sandarakinum]|uniref:hypothetical protein n=1 Tax=Streptosporangium sandarakinum TaxID=1260955 RepID=UPI003D929219